MQIKRALFDQVSARFFVADVSLQSLRTGNVGVEREHSAGRGPNIRSRALKDVDEPSILQENGETAVRDLAGR
jgi:hypothetical protein